MSDAVAQILNAQAKHSMQDAIAVADRFVPAEYRNCPWKLTSHGMAVYTSQDELNGYLSAYGSMHLAKLRRAFELLEPHLRDAVMSRGVNVVDWGCGQGMAVYAFLDFLSERGIDLPVRHVALIEVSKPALERAKATVMRTPTMLRRRRTGNVTRCVLMRKQLQGGRNANIRSNH